MLLALVLQGRGDVTDSRLAICYVGFTCSYVTVRLCPAGSSNGMPGVLTARVDDSVSHGLGSMLVKKPFLP
jgi:hypothetical protein